MNSKVLLTAWLLAPVAIVGGLWVITDRDAARKDRVQRLTAAGLMNPSVSTATVASGASAAMNAGTTAAPAAPVDESKLVAPDFLEQGFVIVVKDLSGKASTAEPIHLASSWNGWNPADPKFKLSARSDLRWQIVMKKGEIDGPIEFKFTRGNSDTWECAADLSSRPNRILPKIDMSKLAPGERPEIVFEVAAWDDMRPTAAARPDLDPYFPMPTEGITGTIKRLQVTGGGVWTVRDLLVWLPPGYDKPENAARKYPVLYLQDGQNVFIKNATTPDEWGADETATRLINEGKIEPMIIVGIPHAGKNRATEYLPLPLLEKDQPYRGKQYAEWLVGEVMPRVERAYRVKPGVENTAVGGSSFGAIISMHAATAFPDKIGKVLLESMSTNFGDGAVLKYFAAQKAWPKSIYFGMGGMERGADPKSEATNKAMVQSASAFEALAKERQSASGGTVVVVVDPKAEHNEVAWKARLPKALETLFPAKAEKAEKKDK
jgi:predicted alpha/beta superfamily hydrolase